MPNSSSHKFPTRKKIVFSELNSDDKNWFAFYLDQTSKQVLVKDLAIISLNKFRFNGYLESSRNYDWIMKGHLNCRIVLECRRTLKHFPISLKTRVLRKFVSNPKLLSPQHDNSIPEDENLELLTPSFDLLELVRETLFLELPEYPTSSGSDFDSSINDDIGKLHDPGIQDNPFSALARDNS